MKDELSIVSTATEVQGQEMMIIMKHVNLSVQGDRAARQGQSEQGEDRESTMRNTSQRKLQPVPKHPRTDAVVQQGQAHGMATRRKQSRTSRTSRDREHQLGHATPAQTASANGSILTERNRYTRHEHRRSSSHHRDRCGSFPSAADGAAAVPDNIR